MRERVESLVRLGLSGTAKTTYLMFIGNVASAVMAFVIIVVVGRTLGMVGLGVFIALYNFVQLVSSVADLGVGSGLVNFIPGALSRGKEREANQYLKAGWDFVLMVSVVLSFIGLIIPLGIVRLIFPGVSFGEWAATVLAATSFILINFVVFIFQARKEFIRAILANGAYSLARMVLVVVLTAIGRLSVLLTIVGYAVSSVLGVVASLPFLPSVVTNKFRPEKKQKTELLKFSRHLGLGKVAANIASRIDVQMLYPLAGAVATAQYGIAQRVAFLYVLFSSSAGAVITPKVASVSDREEMKKYSRKILLLSVVLVAGLGVGVAIAGPLIPLLFGHKYLEAVPVVRWMLVATVPFLLNMTPVNLVIYYQKNSKLIGILSVIQLAIVVLLNWFLIPVIGVYGSIIAYASGNFFVGVATWYKVWGIVF